MNSKSLLIYFLRVSLILILFAVFFMAGATVVAGKMPDTTAEPGLVSDGVGFLIVVAVETFLITALILTSRWSGLKLIVPLPLAYYGAVTFVMQIETWYFLSDITVSPELLPALFIMRIPVTFIVFPLAAWILGKGKAREEENPENKALVMPARQWLVKTVLIAVSYLVLYLLAGYFIAWQNPELRAFYGQPGEPLPFFSHILYLLSNEPFLLIFQLLRGVIWMVCALPVIRGSSVNAWWTALLVGWMFSLPQNIGHILSNPLLPVASVRISHLIETASSTFLFGLIVVWLLHREHSSIKDLFGFEDYRPAVDKTAGA